MQRRLDDDTTLVASDDQISSHLGEETVVLQLESKIYYGLPGTAGQIWERLRKPISVGDLRDELLARYEVEPERCERELLQLLEQMLAAKLIEIRP